MIFAGSDNSEWDARGGRENYEISAEEIQLFIILVVHLQIILHTAHDIDNVIGHTSFWEILSASG